MNNAIRLIVAVLLLANVLSLTSCVSNSTQEPSATPSESCSLLADSSIESSAVPDNQSDFARYSEMTAEEYFSEDRPLLMEEAIFPGFVWFEIDNGSLVSLLDENPTPIYTYESTPGQWESDGIVLFFADGTKIYRMFLPDGQYKEELVCDAAYTSPDGQYSFDGSFWAWSNHTLRFEVRDDEWFRETAASLDMTFEEYLAEFEVSHEDSVIYNSLHDVYTESGLAQNTDEQFRGLDLLGIPPEKRMSYEEYSKTY